MSESNDPSTPLWKQLQATAQVILAVRRGGSGSAAIEQVPASLRPGVQALAFHVWRNLGRAQAIRQKLATRTPPPAVDALLCTALALGWNPDVTPYDPFTLVNQAVEACKRTSSTRSSANFLNACLRRYLREQAQWIAATQTDPEAQWNHPLWWIRRLQKDHPHHWQSILEASNQPAPLTLRVNVRQSSQAQYLQQLNAMGVRARPAGDVGVSLERAMPVHKLAGFEQGMVSVQDAAAQIAAPLLLHGLEKRPGLRILDACAAPGGKTGHLLECTDATVTALEVDATRAQRIHENLARLGLQAHVVHADASQPHLWWDGQAFDAILLDAPCTASGIVRRHPDVRWLRRESDIEQLAAQQRKMLNALWPLVKPGGNLLYCTCSLFLAEGQEQVQTFLANNTDAALKPSPGHLMPQSGEEMRALRDNHCSDHDGFFYALLQKTTD
jgi:16S rRNA (cytosine967-C5)-methyltransferase